MCSELPLDAYTDNHSVLIAYTNLALDHLLTSILDAKITKKIVRLGSGVTDERIAQYSLNKLEQSARHDDLEHGLGLDLGLNLDLDRPRRRQYAILKEVEGEINRNLNRIQPSELTLEDAEKYLDIHYPQHADSLREPPFWIAEVFRKVTEDENQNGGWIEVSRGMKSRQDLDIKGLYGFWKSGRDIEFIQPPPSLSKTQNKIKADSRQVFFNELGFSGEVPQIPSGQRSLELLIISDNVWSMSLSERKSLAESWEEEMTRKMVYESYLESDFYLPSLKNRYQRACQAYEEVQDEVS